MKFKYITALSVVFFYELHTNMLSYTQHMKYFQKLYFPVQKS